MASPRPLHAAALFALSLVACVSHASWPNTPDAGRGRSWVYEVVASEAARELAIDASFPPGSLSELAVRRGAEPFVRDVEVLTEGRWRSVGRSGASFLVPACITLGCRVRYRFMLREAANALDDIDLAKAWGATIEASPAVWLLHPLLAPREERYRFHVATPPGLAFASGVFAAQDHADTYESEAWDLGVAAYSAFGPLRTRRTTLSSGIAFDIAIADGPIATDDDALAAWVQRSADSVARYFGCFPALRTLVLVVPVAGNEVLHGETMGNGGASIVVEVGGQTREESLREDWVLPHEMVHLGFPSVSRGHHWIEEGVAVYVQPIARARAGALPPEAVWREFARGMPKGEPHRGDRGLDDSSSWGRTYWGGAMFCLLADVEIRRRTGNRHSLDDALRGILASGGSIAVVWDFDRTLGAADDAVGVRVLRGLHARMGTQPTPVDLARLFKDLGVVLRGEDVSFDENAPLAAIRREITSPSPEFAPSACRAAPPSALAIHAPSAPRAREPSFRR